MDIIQELEKEQLAKLNKKVPEFKAGDTVKVMYKIVEDKGERLQAYEGVCIARSNNGLNSSFTVSPALNSGTFLFSFASCSFSNS